jgi:hypothetical protein
MVGLILGAMVALSRCGLGVRFEGLEHAEIFTKSEEALPLQGRVSLTPPQPSPCKADALS